MAALAVTVSAIALTGAACGGSDDGDEAETPDVTVETDGMITSDLGGIVVNSPASITVTAQSGDGTTVTIDQVDLPAPGFVLVLDPTPEVLGEFGQIIGASDLLPIGVSSDVEVSLDPTLATSGTLFAEPHVDSNQNGTLDRDPTNGPRDRPVDASRVGLDDEDVRGVRLHRRLTAYRAWAARGSQAGSRHRRSPEPRSAGEHPWNDQWFPSRRRSCPGSPTGRHRRRCWKGVRTRC